MSEMLTRSEKYEARYSGHAVNSFELYFENVTGTRKANFLVQTTIMKDTAWYGGRNSWKHTDSTSEDM